LGIDIGDLGFGSGGQGSYESDLTGFANVFLDPGDTREPNGRAVLNQLLGQFSDLTGSKESGGTPDFGGFIDSFGVPNQDPLARRRYGEDDGSSGDPKDGAGKSTSGGTDPADPKQTDDPKPDDPKAEVEPSNSGAVVDGAELVIGVATIGVAAAGQSWGWAGVGALMVAHSFGVGRGPWFTPDPDGGGDEGPAQSRRTPALSSQFTGNTRFGKRAVGIDGEWNAGSGFGWVYVGAPHADMVMPSDDGTDERGTGLSGVFGDAPRTAVLSVKTSDGGDGWLIARSWGWLTFGAPRAMSAKTMT
jgi:hypothetical protein